MNQRSLSILAIVLALLFLGTGFWAFSLNKKSKALAAENEAYSEEISELKDLKLQLEAEVDSLEQAYIQLEEENVSLKGAYEEAQQEIQRRKAALRRLSAKSNEEIGGLKEQIAALLSAKEELEKAITALQVENDSLRALTGQLSESLAAAEAENRRLNEVNAALQKEKERLTLASYKANAFRVEVERKKPKVTSKSRRARRINVTFDLMNVPPEYQGVQTLYLVITDDKGTPISVSNPIKATLNVKGQTMDIFAVKAKEVNVGENQRLSFTYDLENRLKSGIYRAIVYTDVGMLGAAGFKLR